MTKNEINYTWEIRELKTKTIGETNNVVTEITYFVLGNYVDGEYGNGNLPTRVVVSEQNKIDIPYQENNNFIQYNDLTEEDVLNWVFNIIDREEVEQRFFEELKYRYEQKTGSLVNEESSSSPLPW